MRFTTATIVSALAVAASALTSPDYTKNPSGNAIVSPGLNEIVPEGKAYTIKWQPTTTGPISLVLLRGPSNNVQPLKTLAESIPNSGSFSWTPGTDLEVDTTHYGLLLVVEGTGQYQYSTQFGLGAAAGGSSESTIKISTAGPTSTGAATTTIETTESTTICPETETTSAPATTATPAFSTVVQSTEITTTICPETESTGVPQTSTVAPVSSPSSIPWVSSARTSATSTAIPSGTASASPSASSPVFNGAGRNAISFGAVFAGVLAAFAL
ncbi:hypothetical protein N7499_006391 [Penicillium canescens]|uniref:Yeast cell wall synthesis Kre9/Knh1-like N-terminal domain-containing protein n=1 Tax=Penicillium canescens TaxID=5083 RepID=A0AAD6IE10_PENCN|nr:uncharacterized protein N7446_002079 [Penicillium canescens]KAJ6043881.1 hypothetical protein N7460_005236 [Penicillium canescens]KAJ6055355.1 hypothetical protein N7444_004453 [Penicillium canescens]KAJ6074302.1 hypothetical protein N7446_002079 [Penicillium canescens]KAJ6081517.1 hypothetical protein N7499_006391 [Penicillium canescens]KAJ6176685.1 hypothetical protein N7485_003599 [Penicillium canescens]